MKFIHTADWHLGKLVQGVYMTEDQKYVLEQLVKTIQEERPDAVIIAGDLYDRAVPPTEAVDLLDELLERIVIDLNTPVLAISGNHDSPDRLDFGTRIMEGRGLHLVGQLRAEPKPVVMKDEFGEVHVHLIPYADPAMVRTLYGDEAIRTHDDAMAAIVSRIEAAMDPAARHIFVGHAFVTPGGEPQSNTSDSEKPLSIGGAEHVKANYFKPFHYTALGHLHQAHYVQQENIRYAGSPLKYSISEETHRKCFYIVELDGQGQAALHRKEFVPLRDMRRVSGTIEEIESHDLCDDYVFVTLTDENPVLFPMEKVRAIYPNALYVERRPVRLAAAPEAGDDGGTARPGRQEADPVELFAAFYEEVKGGPLGDEKKRMFADVYGELLRQEGDAV
ncbi:exonuclease SbcCD subunit D [Paenibacillus ginsengarvi]|uniref:Nuclease SbcCD subunit D n=1 Tax=Paenibacillus ginsengarvi TaxID=400777 RepID=A0A3B0AQ77_9BACL|nr:exonuclease SbcCD subunit D [Paenibacillus ginsengarvi]RKN62799.1 exonuclease SbcCD subunit D [Paenibacillus ginsengarvi]